MSFGRWHVLWACLGMVVPALIYIFYIRNSNEDVNLEFDMSSNYVSYHNKAKNMFIQPFNPTLDLQKRRKSKMYAACTHHRLSQKKSVNTKSHLLVDDKHRTIYCYVPKVGCTNWKRIFLYLAGYNNSTYPMNISMPNTHILADRHLPVITRYSRDEARYKIQNYFKFMVVREPFERILSAYRNKFQRSYSTYFHKKFGRTIVRRFRNQGVGVASNGSDVTFIEFLRYLIDPRTTRKKQLNEHWNQQYKLCRPCNIKYDYIARYETLFQDASYILNRMGVSDLVSYPNRSKNYHHNLTSQSLVSFYSQIPLSMLRRLYNIYRIDYELFDYSFPSFISEK